MTWYAVQDSDWDWNSPDGAAAIVDAETPEEAVKLALKSWSDKMGDGGHLKVATLNLTGFIEFEVTNGVPVLGEFQVFY